MLPKIQVTPDNFHTSDAGSLFCVIVPSFTHLPANVMISLFLKDEYYLIV